MDMTMGKLTENDHFVHFQLREKNQIYITTFSRLIQYSRK